MEAAKTAKRFFHLLKSTREWIDWIRWSTLHVDGTMRMMQQKILHNKKPSTGCSAETHHTTSMTIISWKTFFPHLKMNLKASRKNIGSFLCVSILGSKIRVKKETFWVPRVWRQFNVCNCQSLINWPARTHWRLANSKRSEREKMSLMSHSSNFRNEKMNFSYIFSCYWQFFRASIAGEIKFDWWNCP